MGKSGAVILDHNTTVALETVAKDGGLEGEKVPRYLGTHHFS